MKYVCCTCKEDFYYEDEVVGINCNGEEVSLDEYSYELNACNVDYCESIYCNSCYFGW